jgi:protein TonB
MSGMSRTQQRTGKQITFAGIFLAWLISSVAHSAGIVILVFWTAFQVTPTDTRELPPLIISLENLESEFTASNEIPTIQRQEESLPTLPKEFEPTPMEEFVEDGDRPVPVKDVELPPEEIQPDELTQKLTEEPEPTPNQEEQEGADANRDASATLDADDVAIGPVGRDNRPPNYPRRARERGWEGTVRLRLLIDIDGTIARVELVESSGFPILDREAERAVQAWTFHPARDADGKAVPVSKIQPVRFSLK